MEPNPYLAALKQVRPGRTASFAELARLAGRPQGARAAGRAVAGVPADDPRPWHRAVGSDGALAPEAERAAVQLDRLRKEGARPRDGEAVSAWARRRRAALVGAWHGRRCLAPGDERCATLDPRKVEALGSAEEARLRGFEPFGPKDAPRRARGRAPQAARRVTTGREEPAATSDTEPGVRDLSTWPEARTLRTALDRVDWGRVREELCLGGASVIEGLVEPETCSAYASRANADDLFERTVEMGPRGYGIGRYRTFVEPLPGPASVLRERLYAELFALARQTTPVRRNEIATGFPELLAGFHRHCRLVGQRRGSTVLLSYHRGGVNHPHRDLYGTIAFPFQAVVVLSRRGADFEGGDFQLLERASGGGVVPRSFPLDRGDVCVFATRGFWRASKNDRRWVEVEHGMSMLTAGERHALGIVMHLAE